MSHSHPLLASDGGLSILAPAGWCSLLQTSPTGNDPRCCTRRGRRPNKAAGPGFTGGKPMAGWPYGSPSAEYAIFRMGFYPRKPSRSAVARVPRSRIGCMRESLAIRPRPRQTPCPPGCPGHGRQSFICLARGFSYDQILGGRNFSFFRNFWDPSPKPEQNTGRCLLAGKRAAFPPMGSDLEVESWSSIPAESCSRGHRIMKDA